MKRLLIAAALALLPFAAHAGDKPLVLDSGQIKVLPANTAIQANATSTSAASINLPHGTAPSSPNNGDCWTTTTGLFCYINGSTVGPYSAGTSLSPANPTATAGPAAVNGSASTYMRSDAAPAVQKGTNAQFGIVEGDGSSITCTAGICSATGTGTVTTTGSPASGNLTKFSGSSSITNGDLSGDVTTSGTLATTISKIGGQGTRGQTAEYGSGGWTGVDPSATRGWVWTSNGTGADPSWQAVGGSLPGYASAATAAVFMNNFGGL